MQVPLSRLLAYAAPALPLAMLTLPVYIVLPSFYAGAVGLGTVGAVLLLARLWDGVTDPLIGWLSDRTRTRFGRRRPWIVAGLPLTLVSVWQLLMPPVDVGAGHLLVWSMALYLGWTLMIVPMSAWGAELSGDYDQRTRVAGARETAVVLGTMVALALPVALGAGGAGQEGETLRIIAIATVILLPTAVVYQMIAVPEPAAPRGPPAGTRGGWRVLWGNKPFRRLLAAYLLNGFANGLPATLFLLFVAQVLGAGPEAGALLFVYFVCGVASVPVWVRVSARWGKHRTWSVAMIACSVAFATVPFLGPGDVWGFAAMCVATGLMLGADLVLPSSMQADVVDLDTLRTGEQRTGLYFALWSLATKLATALSVGIAFPILEAAGFRADGPNPDGALTALVVLYAMVPIACKLAAVALLWTYPIDAARQARLRRLVERRLARSTPASASQA
jgi:glycoside/pentoside/hexuronide:cation symporter, GPH family